MLMVLEHDAGLAQAELLGEVAMPEREVSEAIANLTRKGLVTDDNGRVCLTEAGRIETEGLWSIAKAQQDQVFGQFSEEQLQTFKTVLKAIISR